jgi:hypothetical protein
LWVVRFDRVLLIIRPEPNATYPISEARMAQW